MCSEQLPQDQLLSGTQTRSCDPTSGVVHLSDCLPCLHYKRHLASASLPTNVDSSSGTALRERDHLFSDQYLRWVRDGIHSIQERYHHLQAHREEWVSPDDYEELLERYRKTKEVAATRMQKLLQTQADLKRVTVEFQALKELFDEMADTYAPLSSSGLERIEEDKERKVQEVLIEHVSKARDSGMSESGNVFQDNSLNHSIHLPSPPPSPDNLTASTFPESSQEPSCSGDNVGECSHSNIQSSPSSRKNVDKKALDIIDASVSVEEISKLMDDAYDIKNFDVRKRLKVFMTTARHTPRKKRTKAQEFFILNYKKPVFYSPAAKASDQPASLSSPSPSSIHTSLPQPAEFFVDSSFWGIGFAMNGRWLAWRLKTGWNESGRDNNWTEMVAVEIGMRALIASGFHGAALNVRSDNIGVVQAAKIGRSKHMQQGEILRNVLHLANEHAIDLKVVWVCSKDNLADKYSRGDAGPRSLVYPQVPAVPPHLEDLIELAIPE